MKPSTSDHPTSAELDMLRAGLLDERPGLKAGILAHVANCVECGKRAGLWRQVVAALDDGLPEDAHILDQLQRRRRAALAGGRPSRRPLVAWPRMLVAAAAAITLGIGIGLVLDLQRPLGPAPASDHAAAQDLYTGLDFYVWLAEQNAPREAADQNGTL